LIGEVLGLILFWGGIVLMSYGFGVVGIRVAGAWILDFRERRVFLLVRWILLWGSWVFLGLFGGICLFGGGIGGVVMDLRISCPLLLIYLYFIQIYLFINLLYLQLSTIITAKMKLDSNKKSPN
jgi:hypothetical protein